MAAIKYILGRISASDHPKTVLKYGTEDKEN